MTGTPRVTALINTYNYGRFVEQAIESVLAQDFPAEQMEIVVVDDGSTDDTRARVAKFGERVRYIYKENGGQASAFNAGFAAARGEIIALLDADDVWQPGKIRRMVEEFQRNPYAGMVCHPYQVWLPATGECTNDEGFTAMSGDIPSREDWLLKYGNFGTCGMAVRRQAVAKLLPVPEDLVIYADTYLVYLMIFVCPVVCIKEHLTRYRHHGENSAAYAGGDENRLRRRWECYARATAHIRHWIQAAGLERHPGVSAFIKRHELNVSMFRFLCQGATRVEFFRYLRTQSEVFAPLWTPRYRAFRALMSLAGLLLGYRRFEWLRDRYRRNTELQQARIRAFPTLRELPARPSGTR